MTSVESKITSKGQVTVPLAIRQQLGIRTGDRVEWTPREDGVLELRKVGRTTLEDLVGILGRPPRQGSVEDMDQALRERFSRARG